MTAPSNCRAESSLSLTLFCRFCLSGFRFLVSSCDVTIAASTCKLSSRSSRAPLAYSPLLTQATLGTTLSTYTTPCSPILPSHPCPFPTGWYLVGVAGVRAAFNRLGHTQHKQAKAAGHALQKKKVLHLSPAKRVSQSQQRGLTL